MLIFNLKKLFTEHAVLITLNRYRPSLQFDLGQHNVYVFIAQKKYSPYRYQYRRKIENVREIK